MSIRTIRPKTFETNSSSTHSVVIAKSSDTVITPTKGVEIRQGEFGWEWKKYTDMYSKASYIFTALKDKPSLHYKENYPKEYTAHVKINDVWEEAVKELGLVLVQPSEGDWTYVDHGVEHLVKMTELHTVKGMIKFITSSKYVLITGNDNEEAPPNHNSPPQDENKLPLLVTLSNQLITETARAERSTVKNVVIGLAGDYIKHHTRRSEHWSVDQQSVTEEQVKIVRYNWSSSTTVPEQTITLNYTVTDAP